MAVADKLHEYSQHRGFKESVTDDGLVAPSVVVEDGDGNILGARGSPLQGVDHRVSDLLCAILAELRIMNTHLSAMTDEHITTEDVERG